MSSTKKGNNYHFGMKVHTGVDSQSGLVHTVKVTTASVHDKQEMDALLHGEEKAVFGDKGYFSDQDKRSARKIGLFWGVLDKAKSKKRLSHKQKRRNRKLSSIRAKVEHPFRVIKRQFGYVKVRYRGLTKKRRRSLRCLRWPICIKCGVLCWRSANRRASDSYSDRQGVNRGRAMTDMNHGSDI